MFESLIDTKNGVAGLIASLVVVLALQLMLRVGEFVWKIIKKKSELSEKTVQKLIVTVESNTDAIKKLESRVGDIDKIRLDLRRSYAAIKFMAGDKWKDVRSVIMGDEDLPS
jgi:hypothetical protein